MVDKVYSLSVRYLHDAIVQMNVLHFAKISAGDPTTAQFLALANAWKECLRPQQSNHVTWTEFVAMQVLGDGVTYDAGTCKQVGGTIQTDLLTGTLVGADASDPLPAMATVSVQLGTGLRGRSFRSKLQLGSYGEQFQTNGVWQAPLISALDTALGAFAVTYAAGGTNPDFAWGVFSRGIASGCFPDPNLRHHPLVHRQAGNAANAFHVITDVTVSSKVTTTRSRIP